MRVSFIIFLLLPCVTSLQDIVDETGSFNRTDMIAMHEGMEQLREHLLKTIGTDLSEKDKNMLKEYNKHPHHLNITPVNKQGDSIDEINAKNKLSEDLYQMDIMLTLEQIEEITHADGNHSTRVRRQTMKNTQWDNNLVYYFLDSSINTPKTRNIISKGIQFWQNNTCIKFQPITRPSQQLDAIRFRRGSVCMSSIGKVGGRQDLLLASGCESVGTVIHELAHALGFVHMQARHDRDRYITVNTANINPAWISQFDKETSSMNDNYGHPYDFGSIMHYSGKSGSLNDQETMIAKDPRYQKTMGSDIPSFLDVQMMNRHYNCKDQCKKKLDCENGGYPQPTNCNKCLCPAGFGGKLCDRRPPGCGRVLHATASPQTFSTQLLGTGSYQPLDDFEECNYMIVAPKGKRIEIQMIRVTAPICKYGCTLGGVELKAIPDMTLTGFRFCCPEDEKQKMYSYHNMMPIILYNRLRYTGAAFEYRFVEDETTSELSFNPEPETSDEKETFTESMVTEQEETQPNNSEPEETQPKDTKPEETQSENSEPEGTGSQCTEIKDTGSQCTDMKGTESQDTKTQTTERTTTPLTTSQPKSPESDNNKPKDCKVASAPCVDDPKCANIQFPIADFCNCKKFALTCRKSCGLCT